MDNLKHFRDKFDLDRCMKDGGKCLAVDKQRETELPCRLICQDRKVGGGGQPTEVLLGLIDLGNYEDTHNFQKNGSNPLFYLRNLPEYKEVEVTLWTYTDLDDDTHEAVTITNESEQVSTDWQRYGPPVKVRFER